jgi:hypothetical protein
MRETVPRVSARPIAVRYVVFAASAGLLFLWALFQNLYRIGTAPILADEPAYTTAAWRYLTGTVGPPVPVSAGHLAGNPDNFEHPPLVKYLFAAAERLAGTPHGLTAARVVSALATLAAAAVVALWVGRLAGRWTGHRHPHRPRRRGQGERLPRRGRPGRPRRHDRPPRPPPPPRPGPHRPGRRRPAHLPAHLRRPVPAAAPPRRPHPLPGRLPARPLPRRPPGRRRRPPHQHRTLVGEPLVRRPRLRPPP